MSLMGNNIIPCFMGFNNVNETYDNYDYEFDELNQ